jgi:hypothetical protein
MKYCAFCEKDVDVKKIEKSLAPHARFYTTHYILECNHMVVSSREEDS